MKPTALLGIKLFWIALLFPISALPLGQLQMTSQDMIRTLHEAGLLHDDTYQQLEADLEGGYSKSRAYILGRMAQDAYQQWLVDSDYPSNTTISVQHSDVEISIDAGSLDSENLENLRLFLEDLNTRQNIDTSELGQFGAFLEQLSAIEEDPSPEDLHQLQTLLEQLNIEQNARANALKARLPQVLEQLLVSGLLTERVYYKLKPEIDSRAIATDFQLYQQAESWMRLDDELSVEILTPELNSFESINILSEDNRIKLTQALIQEEIAHPIQFLNYYNKALLFDLSSYSKQPEDYLVAIHNAVAEMLLKNDVVDTPIDNLEVRLEVNEESRASLGGYRRLAESNEHGDRYRPLANEYSLYYDAIFSAKVNDRTYYQRNFYGGNPEEPNDSYRVTPEDITKLFNKILYDQASPYKVYSVSNFGPTFGDSTELANQVGFIALTKAQADVYFERSFAANHSPLQFTSDRIDEILDLFEQIGLLDHLSPAQIESGRKLIAESYITQQYEIFSAFEDVILLFEWESGNMDTPYQSLTENFAAISREQFSPTEISNEFNLENQTAAQTFILNGTEYNTPLEFNGDWLDPNFFRFIQSVSEQEISVGKFYAVDVGYDAAGYLFLTPSQLEILRSDNLIQIASISKR